MPRNCEKKLKTDESSWIRAPLSDFWWRVWPRKKMASLARVCSLPPLVLIFLCVSPLSLCLSLSLSLPLFLLSLPFFLPRSSLSWSLLCIGFVSTISRPWFAPVVFMFWHQRKPEEVIHTFSNRKGFRWNPCIPSQPLSYMSYMAEWAMFLAWLSSVLQKWCFPSRCYRGDLWVTRTSERPKKMVIKAWLTKYFS